MSDSYRMSDHKEWAAARLDEVWEGHEMEYVNQEDDYGDCLRGEWYIANDGPRVIIWGTFGNYNSPGASHYTYAEVYGPDEEDAYRADLAEWEDKLEYLPCEEENPDVGYGFEADEVLEDDGWEEV